MLELIIQQTNSTVTTTVFQQTSGASWTDVVQVGTAIAVALFAGITFWEGAKNRRKQSLEKQLERLYNPLFTILTVLHKQVLHQEDTKSRKLEFVIATDNDYKLALRAFQNYGHYLVSEEYESVMRFLSEGTPTEDGYGLRVPNLDACLPLISAKRDELKARLEALTAKRYRDEILWILIGVGVTLVAVYMILSALVK